jgi:DNA replication protein DnaC
MSAYKRDVPAEINLSMKELHLPGMRESYRECLQIANKDGQSYELFLLNLLMREQETRQTNRVARLVKQSRLPLEKSLASFERKRLPHKTNLQLTALLDGDFLDRQENVLAFGAPGSGKTHLLCAIGHEMIQHGRRVFFTTCSSLVQDLLKSKQEYALPRALKHLSKYDALIIDDIGYVQQSREEMEVLFTVLAHRYERGSVMLTSNLPFSQWETIFKDPMVTAAAIDRLVHHSVIIELNIESYRMVEARKRSEKSSK